MSWNLKKVKNEYKKVKPILGQYQNKFYLYIVFSASTFLIIPWTCCEAGQFWPASFFVLFFRIPWTCCFLVFSGGAWSLQWSFTLFSQYKYATYLLLEQWQIKVFVMNFLAKKKVSNCLSVVWAINLWIFLLISYPFTYLIFFLFYENHDFTHPEIKKAAHKNVRLKQW